MTISRTGVIALLTNVLKPLIMAVVLVGTVAVNFKTRDEVRFPIVNLARDRGHAFLLRADPVGQVAVGQYLVVTAVFISPVAGEVETPLLCKYFFKGRTQVFYVPVPRFETGNNRDTQVVIAPREFYRGRAEIPQIDMVLSREDSTTYPTSVPLL